MSGPNTFESKDRPLIEGAEAFFFTTSTADLLAEEQPKVVAINPATNFIDTVKGTISIDGTESPIRQYKNENHEPVIEFEVGAYADGLYEQLWKGMEAAGKPEDFRREVLRSLANKQTEREVPPLHEQKAVTTPEPVSVNAPSASRKSVEDVRFTNEDLFVLRDFEEYIEEHVDDKQEAQGVIDTSIERTLEYYATHGGQNVTPEVLRATRPKTPDKAPALSAGSTPEVEARTTTKIRLERLPSTSTLNAKATVAALTAGAIMMGVFVGPFVGREEQEALAVTTETQENTSNLRSLENTVNTPLADSNIEFREDNETEQTEDKLGVTEIFPEDITPTPEEPATATTGELGPTPELFPGLRYFGENITKYKSCVDIARGLHPSEVQLPRSFTLATMYSLMEYASNGNLNEVAPRAEEGTMAGLFGMNPTEVRYRFNELGFDTQDMNMRFPGLSDGELNSIEAISQIMVAYDRISGSVKRGLVDYYDVLQAQGDIIADEATDTYELNVTQEEYEESLYKIYANAIAEFYGTSDTIAGSASGDGLVADIFRGVRRGDDTVIQQLRAQAYNQQRTESARMVELDCSAFIDDQGNVLNEDVINALSL
jgi:hypothetical protein